MTRITAIEHNEQSAAVANLHAAIKALGYDVDEREVSERRAGESTAELVKEFQRQTNVTPEPGALVDVATAAAMNRYLIARGLLDASAMRPYAVTGTIVGPTGLAACGLTVTAFDQDMRKRQSLGTAVTDAKGFYAIDYTAAQFAQAEIGSADLVVTVASPSGELLHTTPVRFNVPRIATVDVALDQKSSEPEYDRLVRELTPLLADQGVTLATLEQDSNHGDVSFAAGETGSTFDVVLSFAVAQRVDDAARIAPQFWYAVLRTGTIAYTNGSAKAAASVGTRADDVQSRIAGTPLATVKDAVAKAVGAGYIAAVSEEASNRWYERYAALQRDLAQRPDGGSPLPGIAAAAGIAEAKQSAFADAYLQGGSRDEVVARLVATKQFTDAEITSVDTTLTIHELILGDTVLLNEIKPGIRDTTGIRTLARLAPADWKATIAKANAAPPSYVAGASIDEKQQSYAALLTKRMAFTYPTAAFAGDLSRAIGAKAATGFRHGDRLVSFFDAHPDFELARTAVDGYMQNKAQPDFFNAGDRAGFTTELKAAQRVFKLQPNFAAVDTLVSDGVHSAQQIYRMGETQFVRKYATKPGFTQEAAQATFQRAANTYASVATLIGNLRATQNANLVNGVTNVVPALDQLPDLATLFGKADICECDECRSIFSPAAYLADALKWLEGRLLADGVHTAKDVLFQRRPDLGYIELTCDNSNTPLPYIDLACEVMEDQVAPWQLFTLPAGIAPDLAAGAPDANLRNAFASAAANAVTLSAAAEVYGPDAFGSYLVRDTGVTYLVAKAGAGFTVSLVRQTREAAAELSSYPEYVNEAAYDLLRGATFPAALPFDLATEEVRAYLGSVNVMRADLMQTFQGPNAPNNALDLDVATEWIGVGRYEQGLLFTTDTAHQFQYWGYADNPSAIAGLAHVDVFLNATGLDFAGLQRLLSLGFVNPGGAITIVNLDSSCDTNMKRLQPLDADALDRVHRFLRLWRKLGWQMWEVDLCILHPALGKKSLDAGLAASLAHVLWLKKRFPALSVEQWGAMFGDINTASKYTQAYRPRDPSLYDQLFQNKRLTNPPDPNYAVAAVTPPLPAVVPTIDSDAGPLLGATKLNQSGLDLVIGLLDPGSVPASPQKPYIDGGLTLSNISFVYRHALFARTLGIKIADWKTLLVLLQQDPFANPAAAVAFVKTVDNVRGSGFTADQLGYILAADLTTKAAPAETSIATLLATLRQSLQTISKTYDPNQIPTDASGLSAAILAQLQTLGWDATNAGNVIGIFNDSLVAGSVAAGMPAAFTAFPAAVTDPAIGNIPVTYQPATGTISFSGVMTNAQKTTLLGDPSLAAVSGMPGYQAAINELFELPRLSIKFYVPRFSAPLAALPPAVVFPSALSARISYDGTAQTLGFFGVMSRSERDVLSALSADAAYDAAVAALYNLPRTGAFATNLLWMQPADLTFPLVDPTDPANAHQISNLSTAETRLVTFMRRTLSTDLVVQQLSTALGTTQATTSALLTAYPLFGGVNRTLLEEFLDPVTFIATAAALSAAAFPNLFVDYTWLHRVSLVLKTLRVADADLVWLQAKPILIASEVLDVSTLPLRASVAPAKPALASVTGLLDLAAFFQWHHTYSEDDCSLLAVVGRLVSDAAYTNALFAADFHTLTSWSAADATALTGANALDIGYPAGFEKADGWRRLIDAFTILGQLDASAVQALRLANPVLSSNESALLRSVLRTQYDEATWLSNSQTIEDGLRERKRDSLVAYLLAQPPPGSVSTAGWQVPNDLLGYYLIDIEMCSCQPSTRILQAYAAVQLFVQRCFMGLEAQVTVDESTDDGWKQWKWMSSFRLWQANREVFAFPENYAEPELRKNKSELFANLENALLQSSITADNVETAFLGYLEGLDDIAQLEIAGTYYQESIKTLHVFGRTAGGDPRTYYYRQFIAGRQWTAWSQLKFDVKGNYLTPFVAEDRLYVVWLEFQGAGNSDSVTSEVPAQGSTSNTTITNDPPVKQMNIFLAISELRNGKWTPKRLTQDPLGTASYTETYDDSKFVIAPIDLTWIPAELFPKGVPPLKNFPWSWRWLAEGPFLIYVFEIDSGTKGVQQVMPLQLAGCRGYPERIVMRAPVVPILTDFVDAAWQYARNDDDVSSAAASNLTEIAGTSLVFNGTEILANVPSLFKVLYPHYLSYADRLLLVTELIQLLTVLNRAGFAERGLSLRTFLGTFLPWFYADRTRTFFVRPEIYLRQTKTSYFYDDAIKGLQTLLDDISHEEWLNFFLTLIKYARTDFTLLLRFATYYHPHTCYFIRQLYTHGVEGLMSRPTQFQIGPLDFANDYSPTPVVDHNPPPPGSADNAPNYYPQEVVDFDPQAGYSLYNWELFYFAPLMVAERLSQNQQFADALRWFHFIFDPTGANNRDPITNASVGAPQKYWITKPFYLRQSADYHNQELTNLMNLLANDPANPTPPAQLQQLQQQVQDWRNDPFDPHLIAQYRQVAYQLLTVMRYLDNLIAWGDQQFGIDSLESVNIATQLYVLAAQILGRRPQVVPPAAEPVPQTFNELDKQLDAFSNAIVEFENLIPPMPPSGGGTQPAPPLPSMLYFCIPQNDQLLRYWDTIERRLYNIRHCLNIDGVFSPAVLFPPPINPMELVKALAGGADLSTALSSLNAPLPYYRFTTTLQKANEFTNDVKALGATLLAALEKNDGEALARLRQGQEIALLQAVRTVKQQQIDDATIVIAELQKTRELTTIKRDYYATRPFMNSGEEASITLSKASLVIDAAIAVGYILSGGLKLVPEFMIGAAGFGGSPTVNAAEGGQQFGGSAEDAVRTLSAIAAALDKSASVVSVQAGYHRRQDDWQFQVRSASKELEQIAQQILSAQKKLEIAKTDLQNQDLQIANSQAVNDFMQSKYTNQELYQWLLGQISHTYFASYNLALDLAKRAEQCFQYELGIEDSSYISYGYWNSLRSGLQSGEALQLDLRRLESAYLDHNRRELECTKHVSLALVDPQALLDLKTKGVCNFDLPEELFDLDYPGHYFRRIKTVSVSIPCVAGPYTTVNASLRLLKNTVRISSTVGSQYEHNHDNGVFTDDERFRRSNLRINAIATSSGQNDSGLFELNFRDERYLPFEGAGAISGWQLELMQEPALRGFAYDTISDVIVHVRYTAREDAGVFKKNAIGHLKDVLAGAPEMPLLRLFDLVHEFPTEWYAFLHPAAGGTQSLQLNIQPWHFPYIASGKTITLTSFGIVVNTKSGGNHFVQFNPPFTPPAPAAPVPTLKLTPLPSPPGNPYQAGTLVPSSQQFDPTQGWTLQFGTSAAKMGGIAPDDFSECYLVVGYTLT